MSDKEMLDLLVSNGLADEHRENVQRISGLPYVNLENLKEARLDGYSASFNGVSQMLYRVDGLSDPEVCYILPLYGSDWTIHWNFGGCQIILNSRTFRSPENAGAHFRLIRTAIQGVPLCPPAMLQEES